MFVETRSFILARRRLGLNSIAGTFEKNAVSTELWHLFFCQGEEIGPLELQIHTLQKQIEARLNEITGLQQFWLRNQSELVKTLKDVQKQSEDMEYLKKQYTILLQKKLRIEGEKIITG